MWPKFHNSRISMKEVKFNFIRIWQKKTDFFERSSWFKFNNLGLELGLALKIQQWGKRVKT